MIVDFEHHKWRKRLLELRKDGTIYHMIGKTAEVDDILFMYCDDHWEFGNDSTYEVVTFENDDLAAEYIICLDTAKYGSQLKVYSL